MGFFPKKEKAVVDFTGGIKVSGTSVPLSAAEMNVLDSVTAGTITASKAVVVDASKKVNEWGVTSTITSATPSTTRLTQSSITCTPATTFAVSAGGSLAGVRGDITITTGKSFTDGFLYGAQGKVTNNGTMAEASAARIAGVLGQVDLSTGTITAGQVCAVWGDLQGNPTLTVNDQVYVGRFTNSMSAGKKAQAFQLMYGEADFLFEAAKDGGGGDWVVAGAVGGSQSHKLKVLINGTTFYIPMNTA